LFFSSISLLMLATVFVGFARTYYLAGVFHAPLPSRIVHIHGAALSSWILVRAAGHAGRDVPAFYIVPLMDMVIFATLLAFAFRARRDPAAPKRLIYLATLGLLIAAVARWPFAIVKRNAPAAALFSYVFLLALMSYDLWSTRKIHRVTPWAGTFVVVLQQLCHPMGQITAWSQVGCKLTLVNRSYFFIWLCSSFTTRSQALFLPVSRPPQTWESLHRLSPVLGSITVKMQARTGACQPESTTGSSRT
jgi:FtsH-binding integral membrane protein